MQWQVLGAVLACACVAAQQQPTPAEKVAAVLQANDPVRNGNGAGELLAPGAGLDAEIRATARSATAGKMVRMRALRLARALDLAQRLKNGQGQRDVAWWLALDEIDRELPKELRALLLARAFPDAKVLAAAQQELAAANDIARRFCREWNETRWRDEAHAEENRHYDELEAAIKKTGAAAVPFLLNLLAIPPEIAFPQLHEEQGMTPRQQVRAILCLAICLKPQEAVPYLVMQSHGPSLTQSGDAAAAIQQLTGEHFGAAIWQPGDDAALMEWWNKHRAEHEVVLDHLVRHVVQWAQDDIASAKSHGFEGAWCAVMRLDRVLGKDDPLPRDSGPEIWRARLDDLEREWLQRKN
jgi:hypothetical protein